MQSSFQTTELRFEPDDGFFKLPSLNVFTLSVQEPIQYGASPLDVVPTGLYVLANELPWVIEVKKSHTVWNSLASKELLEMEQQRNDLRFAIPFKEFLAEPFSLTLPQGTQVNYDHKVKIVLLHRDAIASVMKQRKTIAYFQRRFGATLYSNAITALVQALSDERIGATAVCCGECTLPPGGGEGCQ